MNNKKVGVNLIFSINFMLLFSSAQLSLAHSCSVCSRPIIQVYLVYFRSGTVCKRRWGYCRPAWNYRHVCGVHCWWGRGSSAQRRTKTGYHNRHIRLCHMYLVEWTLYMYGSGFRLTLSVCGDFAVWEGNICWSVGVLTSVVGWLFHRWWDCRMEWYLSETQARRGCTRCNIPLEWRNRINCPIR